MRSRRYVLRGFTKSEAQEVIDAILQEKERVRKSGSKIYETIFDMALDELHDFVSGKRDKIVWSLMEAGLVHIACENHASCVIAVDVRSMGRWEEYARWELEEKIRVGAKFFEIRGTDEHDVEVLDDKYRTRKFAWEDEGKVWHVVKED